MSDIGSEAKAQRDKNEKFNKAQQRLNNFFNI